MIEQLNAYLNDLDRQLEMAEDDLASVWGQERIDSIVWYRLLVLRGERVGTYEYAEVYFDHRKSGHGF